MRVLVSETPDKQTQRVLTLSPARLTALIREDYGIHEIIPMIDPEIWIRPFFDIDMDVSGGEPDAGVVLDMVLTRLNQLFGCSDDAWAIASRCRSEKVSFHVVGRHWAVTLQYLRKCAALLNDLVDTSVYWPPLWNTYEEGSFCLPNQSKGGINKEGGPLTVIQGELSDFFVTLTADQTTDAADTIPNSH
jgi:hypothetical protein